MRDRRLEVFLNERFVKNPYGIEDYEKKLSEAECADFKD